MIFNSDLLVGTIILIAGLGFWAISMTEHNNVYVDAVSQEYLLDKGISTMDTLVSSGKLQDAVLLYYLDNGDGNFKNMSANLLRESIPLKKYKVVIDNYTLIDNNLSDSPSYMVIATLTLNRSEGWYVIYGNSSEIHFSNERYIDYDEALNNARNTYAQGCNIIMPVYYSKNQKISKVKLYVGG